jgi:hypothetical protein
VAWQIIRIPMLLRFWNGSSRMPEEARSQALRSLLPGGVAGPITWCASRSTSLRCLSP